ncbi:MAG: hypothetical protein ACYDCL_12480, partial [Myxococcales bacterium]
GDDEVREGAARSMRSGRAIGGPTIEQPEEAPVVFPHQTGHDLKGVGGDAGSFSVTARAVGMPGLAAPSSISRSANLTLSWTPDPNATTLQVSLRAETAGLSHGEIVCNLPSSMGSATVDASLLSNFETGDSVYMVASNEDTTLTQTQIGPVAFEVNAGFYAVGSMTR